MYGKSMAAPVVGIASTPTGNGYWLVGSDGGIFTFGDAGFYGSMGGKAMNAPVVGIAPTTSGHGYWLVGRDGGIFSFGDVPYRGSMGGQTLAAPIVGIASTPTNGYWLAGRDGGIFSFGAPFYGSMGGKSMNAPVVGIASTPTGKGYRLVGADGGIFDFGDAAFYGSTSAIHLAAPVVGIATAPGGRGYWLVGADSGIFSFGPDAPFLGTGACTTDPVGTVTLAKLQQYFGNVPSSTDVAALNEALQRAGGSSNRRKAAMLAVIYSETLPKFDYASLEGRSSGCAKYTGGCDYRGRGYIQLTHKYNYQAAGDYLRVDLVNNPELARSRTYSPMVFAWYWTSHSLNGSADNADINAVTKAVNGSGAPSSRLKADCQRFRSALQMLGATVPSLPC